ncbi:DUF1345 domain-containing protein [Gordonia sp. ABSL11-1]|uniref:DUF1345 domain-containing protein n=1 Tax=Gordonia sp. ABSL11-1 TaxID=3053924 RepID=UPI002572516C|nr:DUF1345 domain-containing protein [Gordonia sp. ABSL11-1]MDL9946436.1 DUF1345 domain-containing protein [Gordonia sp. ABSL11-1]
MAWLSEPRRALASFALGLVAIAVLYGLGDFPAELSVVDAGVFGLLAYLVAYLAITVAAFSRASTDAIHDWARRESRGTVLQRYVLGTAPGPGVSLFIAAAALAVAMIWMPGHGGTTLAESPRIGVAVALIVVAWLCVVVSYAVTFHADDFIDEGDKGLDFPGDADPVWVDYVYFAVSVMTTFGTTDVTVTSREMRRTVTANAVIAFVFNTVIIAAVVSALTG